MSTDRDDRWGDDEPDDRPARRDRRPDPEAGRRKVKGPAIGLIATAVLTLGLVGYEVYQFQTGAVDAEFEKQMKQIDENKGIPADQKKMQKDILVMIRDGIKAAGLPMYGAQALVLLLLLLGGVQMLRLSSRGLSYTAAVLAMIPCVTSYVCLLGLPFGIWAIVVLGHPDVKAAFAARRGRPDRDEPPDELDDR